MFMGSTSNTNHVHLKLSIVSVGLSSVAAVRIALQSTWCFIAWKISSVGVYNNTPELASNSDSEMIGCIAYGLCQVYCLKRRLTCHKK